jgi:hypothetical protein
LLENNLLLGRQLDFEKDRVAAGKSIFRVIFCLLRLVEACFAKKLTDQ